jgi:CheR methyltransferase-like protein
LRRRSGDDEIRVWSAGCATGEEAYSVAILFAEALGDGFAEWVKVFGTDVDLGAVAFARRGVYAEQALAGMRAPCTTAGTRTPEGDHHRGQAPPRPRRAHHRRRGDRGRAREPAAPVRSLLHDQRVEGHGPRVARKRAEAAAGASTSPPGPPASRVLVVDDDEDNRLVSQQVLIEMLHDIIGRGAVGPPHP